MTKSFSLIVATLGRTTELADLLRSLESQSWKNFEVIIVDQNPDERVAQVLRLSNLRVTHIRQDAKGASRARNAGLQVCTGDIVAFPDDDCTYPAGLLEQVAQWFDTHASHDGLTVEMQDASGRPSHMPWHLDEAELNTFNVWTHAIMIGMFLRSRVTKRVGLFNPELGVGAGTPWGSGEETDYLLRALNTGFRIRFDPSMCVWHPDPAQSFDARAIARGRNYGAGMGRVLTLHGAPPWQKAWVLMRALIGVLLGIGRASPARVRFHWNVFLGRLHGLSSGQP